MHFVIMKTRKVIFPSEAEGRAREQQRKAQSWQQNIKILYLPGVLQIGIWSSRVADPSQVE